MRKYPLLVAISAILDFVGWIAVLIGIVIFAWGLSTLYNAVSSVGQGNFFQGFQTAAQAGFILVQAITKIGSGIGLIAFGLTLMLVGEVGRLFINIENSVARSAEALVNIEADSEQALEALSVIEDNTGQALIVLRNIGGTSQKGTIRKTARTVDASPTRSAKADPGPDPCTHDWGEARLQPDGRWTQLCALCGEVRDAP
jgi:hypothetical protein